LFPLGRHRAELYKAIYKRFETRVEERALALFPPRNYSTAVDTATRIEHEDKMRFISKAAHPTKKFPAKRSFG
jgi:hypothetical protein